MNPNEVNRQIAEDQQKFLNGRYDGNTPENLLEKFEKAIMVVPPQAHGVNFTKVKSILDKQIEELSVSDINDIIKVVVNTPLQAFYDELFDAVPDQIKLERFILKFNDKIKEFQDSSNQKRKRLETLSDGVLKTNGMRIIPNGNY